MTQRNLYLRIPAALIDRVDQAAETERRSLNKQAETFLDQAVTSWEQDQATQAIDSDIDVGMLVRDLEVHRLTEALLTLTDRAPALVLAAIRDTAPHPATAERW